MAIAPIHIEALYAATVARLRAQNDLLSASQRFAAGETTGDKVAIAYEILEKDDALPGVVGGCKSAVHSKKHRTLGNGHFQKGAYGDALRCYNEAIAHAPRGSPELALGFSNRSAALLSLTKYEECLADIERALEIGCDDSVEQKLINRKAVCEESTKEPSKKIDLTFEEERSRMFPPPKQNHPLYPCASAVLKVSHTSQWGRFVTATEDVRPGTVLAVEKPYLTMLRYNPHYYTRCSECLEIDYNLLPCERCCYAMYCSEDCMKKAFERGHRYLCPLMYALMQMGFTKIELLSIYTVTTAKCDLESWKDFMNAAKEAERHADDDLRGFFEERIYDSKHYCAVHMLETNIDKRDVSDMFTKAITAAVFLHLLKKYTDMFDDCKSDELDDVHRFVGGLLFHHIMTGASNMHSIESVTEDSNGNFISQEDYASGAYAFLSLINHSCTPNVSRLSLGTSQILMALRPIKSGEQLFDNYGRHYAMHPYENRQSHLSFQYKFKCCCQACVEHWPTYLELPLARINAQTRRKFKNIISSDLIDKLQKGDRETALNVVQKLYFSASLLDPFAPCKDLADHQETIKQCWALFGNVKYNK